MAKENNKIQVDIDNLKKQNVNDLSAIKELYRKLKEMEEKISQNKYIDNTLTKKLKKEYEKLKKIILDENIQVKLTNDIETINSKMEDIETINSKMEDIETKIENYKVINVLEHGVIANNINIDNTVKINEIIANVGDRVKLYFPKGTYYFQTPLKIKNVDIEGDGFITKFVYVNSSVSTFIEFGGNKNTIKKLKLVNNTKNFDLLQKGLVLGEMNNNGQYVYSNRLKAEYIEIENFHTSLSVEACYVVDLDNIYTYKDMFGFTVNKETYKQSNAGSLICTTILANHLYCNGTGGAYTQPTNSIGWEFYETSDITLNNCISEMYERSFKLENINNIQMFAPYFENTVASSICNNITGSLFILNPYINNVINNDSDISFMNFNATTRLTWIGGRVLTSKTIGLINKTNDSSVTLINPPIDNPVNSTSGWEYSGVFILDKKGIINKSVRNATEYGMTINFYGTGLQFSPTTINQKEASKGITFALNGANKMKIYEDGNVEIFDNAKGFYLHDNNGKKYKVFVNKDGVLTTLLQE
ncbi:hypothetical protein [Methanobrevibacter sp.]|uniref:hypothetical protein n=1 Tax=Methanobrevibacter sp. TaxID=66852 RepID=UPI002E7A3CF5|nr:hypothetical protein [Methanobrevibacter sp.]MEE0025938.1 hypothetical protein [Methanobrevibacter sp.]